jgi:hypothetical protein
LRAAVVLLALASGLWVVARIEPPAESRAEPDVATSVSATPTPARVVVAPGSVTAGTGKVRVTVFCRASTATADVVSAAFTEPAYLETSSPPDRVSGEVELERRLAPGTYEVIAECGESEQFGRAEFVVTPGEPDPKPTGPPRIATTWITLAEAAPGAWRKHPGAETSGLDSGDENLFELKVTHELRVPFDDPDVAALRAGAAGYSPRAFAESRLGTVHPDVIGPLDLAFGTPVIRMERSSRQAVVTFSGSAYDWDTGDFIGVEYVPPRGSDVLPLSAHEIVISARGWTVAGVHGPAPLTQDAHYLRLSGDNPVKTAFVRDGEVASVASYLTGDAEIGAYIEARDREEETETPAPEVPDILARGWEVVQTVAFVAGALLLFATLLRALGGAWWRRRRNWVLLAVLATAYGLILYVPGWPGVGTGLALLLVAVPLLALDSAARAVPDRGWEPVAAGSVAAALAGATVSLWALSMLVGLWGAPLWWLAGAAALAVAVAVVPRWRRWLPGVALLVLASGVLLGGRAMTAGIVPMNAIWVVLLAIAWSLMVFGWVTEAAGKWSLRTGLVCAVIMSVTIGVLTSIIIPDMTGQDTWAYVGVIGFYPQVALFMLFALPLLALAMLVVRVRRAGQRPEGLTETTVFHTAVLFVLLVRGQGFVMPTSLGIKLLLAWAGILWLLPAAGRHVARTPVSAEEHRLLVRDMIKRRSARAALTELLRQPPDGDDYEERRAALERSGDERSGPLDSDLALATLAGRTPWQNALAALAVGTVLSLPFSTVRIVESIGTRQTDSYQLLVAALTALSLPVLCMVFGYFYPRVRGTNPIAKSLAFLVIAPLPSAPAREPPPATSTP